MADDTVVTLRDILAAVGSRADRLEDRLDRVDARMERLTETTNHRLDDFHEALELKADAEDVNVAQAHLRDTLLPTVAGQAVHSRIFWTIMVATILVMGPVVADHWHMLAERVSGVF